MARFIQIVIQMSMIQLVRVCRLGTPVFLYTNKRANILSPLVTVSICVERSNRIKVTLSGPKEELHELSEQLAWLTASLRICPESTAMLSSIEFGVIGTDPAESKRLGYRIATSDLNDLSASSGHFDMCWLPLFKNTPIAQGFDVPAREDQQGLELSFKELITLAGIDCPLDRNGRLIFVGISTILIPMKINEDGSVQWHLSVSNASDRLQQYDKNHEIESVFPSTLIGPLQQSHTSTDLLIQRLSETRHFLGWTKKVRVLLGTDEGQYDSATWTTTKEERTTKHISSQNISFATSFSFGTSGKGIMGINFGRTYDHRDNRNPRIPFSNKDNRFEEVLDNRKDELILLYDPLEQRAWMVPLLSILLHMAIIRIKRDGYGGNGDEAQGVTLPYAKAGWDGSEEARKALRKYRFLELGPQDSKKPYRLQELATNLIYAIQNTYPQCSSRLFQKQNLFGYEFMDIVTMEPPFRLKKSSLSMPNGGWEDFVRDVQVVLFCCGIGDALVPDQDVAHPCVSWQTVPKHMNYLGATVKGLKHLAARTGHKESCQYLLEGYVWRCPSNSFDYACNALTDHSQCSCEPLQKLEKVSKWRIMLTESISPAEIIVDEGAVIFGQPSNSVSKKRRVSHINGPEEHSEPLTGPSSQPVSVTVEPPQLSPDNLSKLANPKFPLRRWQDHPRRPRETEPSPHGDLHSTIRRERYVNRVLSHMSKSAGAENIDLSEYVTPNASSTPDRLLEGQSAGEAMNETSALSTVYSKRMIL